MGHDFSVTKVWFGSISTVAAAQTAIPTTTTRPKSSNGRRDVAVGISRMLAAGPNPPQQTRLPPGGRAWYTTRNATVLAVSGRAYGGGFMTMKRRGAALVAGVLLLAACSQSGEIPATVCVGEATTYLDWLNGDFLPDTQNAIEDPGSSAGDLLETIQQNGVLRVATDSDYAPQSFRQPDGSWEGFDIDVATAHRGCVGRGR